MSRMCRTFSQIDVSTAQRAGPDLADLMNVSAPVLISVDLCRMSQLACSFPPHPHPHPQPHPHPHPHQGVGVTNL